MEPYTDQALIEEVRGGSRVAFDQLMQRYQGLVYRVCYSYTRNPDDAMDVTQDVFLKVYANLGSFRGAGPFRSWLLRVAHRENINWLRSHRKYEGHEETAPDRPLPAPATQESDVLRTERRRHLAGAMKDLNSRQRLAISLRYYEGMPIRDIAAVLKSTEASTRVLLCRSLRKLRSAWVLREAL